MAGIVKSRRGVLTLLILLFGITYLDRVCISVAGPRIQADLGISPSGWGWVTGMFTFAYCLFEIPSGVMGDRIGPRRVLTRIVLWWSLFTALTGTMTRFVPLLVTRFLFGAGEAGAYPNSSIVVSRWFPAARRATLAGVILMASQIGGGLAPLLVVPIQMRWGWRASFFIFGVMGVGWAAAWYFWFRDSPPEAKEADGSHVRSEHSLPWGLALGNSSVLAMLGAVFCYAYVYVFFQTWFHTFLVKGRGFSEEGLLSSALPFLLAACTNLAGGGVSDLLVRKLGPRRGRGALGVFALAIAGVFVIVAASVRDASMTILALTLVYSSITLQQSTPFGFCLDVGQKYAGAMVGLMNTAFALGGLVGSVMFGYIVERFGSYDAPFLPMAALLFTGSLLWSRVDSSRELGAGSSAAAAI